jgi:hypothetical protein
MTSSKSRMLPWVENVQGEEPLPLSVLRFEAARVRMVCSSTGETLKQRLRGSFLGNPFQI